MIQIQLLYSVTRTRICRDQKAVVLGYDTNLLCISTLDWYKNSGAEWSTIYLLNGVTEVIRCLANHEINRVICPNNQLQKDNFEP
jgi:hypothetical protein